MKAFAHERKRVRQLAHWKMPRDFVFGPFSFITLLLVSGAGLAVEFARQGMEARHLAYGAGAVLAAAALIGAAPTWATVIVAELALWMAYAVLPEVSSLPLAAIVSAGLLLAPSVQLVYQWDKAVILRLGKFRRVRGPGRRSPCRPRWSTRSGRPCRRIPGRRCPPDWRRGSRTRRR